MSPQLNQTHSRPCGHPTQLLIGASRITPGSAGRPSHTTQLACDRERPAQSDATPLRGTGRTTARPRLVSGTPTPATKPTNPGSSGPAAATTTPPPASGPNPTPNSINPPTSTPPAEPINNIDPTGNRIIDIVGAAKKVYDVGKAFVEEATDSNSTRKGSTVGLLVGTTTAALVGSRCTVATLGFGVATGGCAVAAGASGYAAGRLAESSYD